MDDSESLTGEPVELAPEPAPVPCRRCRKPFDPRTGRCPLCGARTADAPPESRQTRPLHSETDRALLIVCVSYGLMLAMHVVWGMVVSQGITETPEHYVLALLLIDGFFLGAGLVAWWKTRHLAPTLEPSRAPVKAWLAALPLLAIALAGNVAYHRILTDVFHIPVDDDYVALVGSLTAAILLVCVEPALVEEFFFRGVAWKSLRPQMGPHATVLVTSAMFGMAHIGVPVSVPVLFGVGIVLGYLRLWSGSLWPSILVHFLHNLVVVLFPEL